MARQLYRHALTGDLRVPATEGEGHWSGDAKEGWEFADWLNSHGIAAFVLKYRLAKAPDSKYTLPEHV